MMAADSDIERLKATVHRRGGTSPKVDQMVTEVRTPGTIPGQEPDPSLKLYMGFQILVEWTFSVPYSQLADFHTFLRDNEDGIANGCAAITNGNGRYLGTWWNFGLGSSHYRTLWQWKSDQAIADFKTALKNSPNLRALVKQLRLYWSRDPGRKERVYQPAALFSNLAEASKGDAVVELTLESDK
jgi:hypothetical protein